MYLAASLTCPWIDRLRRGGRHTGEIGSCRQGLGPRVTARSHTHMSRLFHRDPMIVEGGVVVAPVSCDTHLCQVFHTHTHTHTHFVRETNEPTTHTHTHDIRRSNTTTLKAHPHTPTHPHCHARMRLPRPGRDTTNDVQLIREEEPRHPCQAPEACRFLSLEAFWVLCSAWAPMEGVKQGMPDISATAEISKGTGGGGSPQRLRLSQQLAASMNFLPLTKTHQAAVLAHRFSKR